MVVHQVLNGRPFFHDFPKLLASDSNCITLNESIFDLLEGKKFIVHLNRLKYIYKLYHPMQSFIIILVTTFSFFSVKSSNLNIVRDAETENFLKEISYILIKDNNLELNNLNFFIDNKDFINAFVIPGQKIFLTKGLLMKSKKIEDLAGVIAHEIGHIIGGHFSEKLKALKKLL